MKAIVHVLNGSCLEDQFPKSVSGELIVAHLCLVDGPVKADDLEDLLELRASFLDANYEGISKAEYFRKANPFIESMSTLKPDSEINLWFEMDLFCQVNLWFILNLLHEQDSFPNINLVLPNEMNKYGFGGMSEKELISAFDIRTSISLDDIERFSNLWIAYQNGDTDLMLKIGDSFEKSFPFVLPVIHAHIDRIPTTEHLGRPKESILQIMESLDTTEFGPIFQAFCSKEAIYGFGDIQVKRLFDEVLKSKS